MWQPSGRPNNATVRCVCRHTPLYVGICCNALLRPTSLGARHKTGDWPKNKSPARAGALTGARGALGLEGGPLSLEQHRRSDVVPIENRNSASAGRSRHPSALAPHSAFPRSPPVCGERSFRKMAKRGNTPEESDRPITICAEAPNSARKPKRPERDEAEGATPGFSA
jgi:hypothetical protein